MNITKSQPYTETLEAGKVLTITLDFGSVLIEGFLEGNRVIKTSSAASTTLGPYVSSIDFKISLVTGVATVSEAYSAQDSGIKKFDSLSAIPPGFSGTAQVGTQLYVGDGVNLFSTSDIYYESMGSQGGYNVCLVNKT